MTTALENGERLALRFGRSLPPGMPRCPLYRRTGGLQARYGQVRKISPPPVFDSRTVQPAASRYTDYATRSVMTCVHMAKLSLKVMGKSTAPSSWWHTFLANNVLFFCSSKNRFKRKRHFFTSHILKQIRLDMKYQVLKLFLWKNQRISRGLI